MKKSGRGWRFRFGTLYYSHWSKIVRSRPRFAKPKNSLHLQLFSFTWLISSGIQVFKKCSKEIHHHVLRYYTESNSEFFLGIYDKFIYKFISYTSRYVYILKETCVICVDRILFWKLTSNFFFNANNRPLVSKKSHIFDIFLYGRYSSWLT